MSHCSQSKIDQSNEEEISQPFILNIHILHTAYRTDNIYESKSFPTTYNKIMFEWVALKMYKTRKKQWNYFHGSGVWCEWLRYSSLTLRGHSVRYLRLISSNEFNALSPDGDESVAISSGKNRIHGRMMYHSSKWWCSFLGQDVCQWRQSFASHINHSLRIQSTNLSQTTSPYSTKRQSRWDIVCSRTFP